MQRNLFIVAKWELEDYSRDRLNFQDFGMIDSDVCVLVQLQRLSIIF